ncbi:cupin domain-containing protein [Antarctobacter sp.]|uniref:cupin domain-containing protein n=1 Tax=Antarctobacter sp. TaxID=1872577 RepID=UPI003A9121EA
MSEYPIVVADDGITRQILADHPDLMMVACQYEKPGAARALHHHRQVQTTFVQSGRFRFCLGGAEHEVGPGDSLVIPSGLHHGCTCLEPGTMIDSFTPRRDDFL